MTPPIPGSDESQVRLLRDLVQRIQSDLQRPHAHALERVGFLTVSTSRGQDGEWILYGMEYISLPDEHYVQDENCGARIGGDAIRVALREILRSGYGILHVHMHGHRGRPEFSKTDLREQPALVDSFANLAADRPHGMLVLSEDSCNALIRLPGSSNLSSPRRLTIVGDPLVVVEPGRPGSAAFAFGAQQFARQSFLGVDSEQQLASARVVVVGMGGGGSHVVQQLAHLGAKSLRVIDGDKVETTNLNRLVGATLEDAEAARPKVDVAKRVVISVLGATGLQTYECDWEDAAETVRSADVLVGCLDTFAGRRQLEAVARRHLIPYIDIGMDVHKAAGEAPQLGGQVIVSIPGGPCMHCIRFLTEANLAAEAANYGAAGGRPQVVWPNGLLASTAVGIVVDLLTGWSGVHMRPAMLVYDGNQNLLVPHPRLAALRLDGCRHYPASEVGHPTFRPVVG